MIRIKLAFAAATFALAASHAFAAEIVPALPSAFDPVNLRMTVDSCTFVPGTVRVSSSGNTLRVTQQPNACLVPGTPEVVDIRLGSLAPGDYRVEVYASPDTNGPAAETLAFTVTTRAEIAVFPPPHKPLTDYTGLWWTPSEGGWGLSLHQGGNYTVFGAWFVYGANGQPEWFTLQSGQWTSATTWTGTVYRNTGPFFAGPDFDPTLVLVQAAGSATLDFRQVPGDVGRARFTWTVNGVTTTKVITRLPL